MTGPLLSTKLHRPPVALEKLTAAINLAQTGGFIRLFVDLGPPDGRSAETARQANCSFQ
ncbi:MAG: hypothetical protein GY850_01575 [bacterium]|nr:hypothetical protein [bacterium]